MRLGWAREGDLPDPEELHQELILVAAQVELERLTKRASFSGGEEDFENAAEVASVDHDVGAAVASFDRRTRSCGREGCSGHIASLAA